MDLIKQQEKSQRVYTLIKLNAQSIMHGLAP